MRWLVYGVAGSLLLLAAGIAVLSVQVIESGPQESGGLFGQPTVGGPFTLVNGAGETVTEASFKGKVMVVYFGFTFCPDICPTELAAIADAVDLLPPAAQAKVQPIFITVDPERDTPEAMQDYVANFGVHMVGLTGTPEQIRAAAKAYRVYYAKQEPETDDAPYLMAHSSYIYVMDGNGRYLKHFSVGATPEEIAAGLKAAVATTG